MARVLRSDTFVAGRWFAAGSTPPELYARRITNPSAWTGQEDVMTGPVPNDNDTSQGPGETTRVVIAPPTGVTGGPEPRPGPSTGGTTAGAGPAPQDGAPPAGTGTKLSAPPRSGKGSGTDAWEAFARVHGVTLPDDFDRAEIIAACEDAGLVHPA